MPLPLAGPTSTSTPFPTRPHAAQAGCTRRLVRLLGALSVGACLAGTLTAQDTRTVLKPTIPAICKTYTAPLAIASGGVSATDDTDSESLAETNQLQALLNACTAGQAVELTLGTTTNAFLINPIKLPAGVSLAVDAGVTVFASRNPANYQQGTTATCGVAGAVGSACKPFISAIGDNSGIYGYGVLDGRGYANLTTGPSIGTNWWYQTATLASGNLQNLPDLILAYGNNFTLYEITLRNAAKYHVIWENSSLPLNGFTAWDIKVQSPWDIHNTDGIDIWGSNATVAYSTFANGDDDIAIDASTRAVANITLDHLTTYGNGGLAVGSVVTYGVSNVVIQNSNLTSNVVQVNGTAVNGVTQATMQAQGIKSYLQALPAYSTDPKGLDIKSHATMGNVNNVTYNNICLQGISHPILITPFSGATGTAYPTITGITYNNIHVLPALPALGLFQDIQFQGYTGGPTNQFTLNNVVVDDQANGTTSLARMEAHNNLITTTGNVYPATFNQLAAGLSTFDGTTLTTGSNTYASSTGTSSPSLAYQCPANIFPFIAGDLSMTAGSQSDLTSATVAYGGSITLNAIVQPAMSQVNQLVMAYPPAGNTPVIAIGAPALTQPIQFYDGSTLAGSAALSQNGTLATLTLKGLTAGLHTYTAQYPGDGYYAAYTFGSIAVTVAPAPGITVVATPAALTLQPGASGNTALTITPAGGLTGAVSVTCSSPVTYITCTASVPAAITGTAATTSTVQIGVAATLASLRTPAVPARHVPVMAVFFPLGSLLLLRNRRYLRSSLLVLVAAFALTVSGCGGGSATATVNTPPNGTQVVTLTTTAGGVSVVTPITITVN